MSVTVFLQANAKQHSAEMLGGKGQGLAQLIQVGLSVPPTVVISTKAFHQFFSSDLRALAREVGYGNDPEAYARLTALVRTRPLPVDVTAVLQVLGKPPWLAVRSSAAHEDSERFSGAGVLRSFLGVPCVSTRVTAAIKAVWLSALADPARIYARLVADAELLDGGIAVVLQPMVNACVSGVAFAQIEGTRVEAIYGLPFPLVNGIVTPDTYVTREKEVTTVHVESYKRTALVLHDSMWDTARPGSTITLLRTGGRALHGVLVKRNAHLTAVRLEYPHYDASVLDESDVYTVAALAKAAISARHALNVDIEWAETVDGWTLLQSRPITTPIHLKPSTINKVEGVAPGETQGLALDPTRTSLPFPFGALLLVSEFGPQHLPLLAVAGGVISQRGGMLSHGAILCRELRKPMLITHTPHTHLHGLAVRINGTSGALDVLPEVGA